MTLSIGLNIKNLRTAKKYTQEQLATFLGVTSQAVSRWENSTTYPDIEMIPSIASFFGVTTDELFGINKDEKEKRRKEIYLEISKGYETGRNTGKDAISIAREYAAEFPSDEKIVLNLADTIMRSLWHMESPDTELLNEAEKLYETVIDAAQCDNNRYEAIQRLAMLYAIVCKDENKAESVIGRLPEMSYSAECIGSFIASLPISVLSIKKTQDYIEKLTCALCGTLEDYIIDLPNGPETWDGKIGMFEQLISLYSLVFGDNLLEFHSDVAELYRIIATYKVAQNRYEDTILCLEKMTYHIIEKNKVKPGDRYTSPFTDMLSCPEDGHSEARIHNEAWYVLNDKLSQERYDPIRNTDGFRKVTEALASIAE